MQRRQFVRGIAGALTCALVGCRRRDDTDTERTGPMNAATFRTSRRFAETRFGRIAYVEKGAGPPAALFLHGFPLSGFQWRGALDRLAPHRRSIAPDFLGLGFTEGATGQSLAPAAQAEMLAALLDVLSIERADLVANDSGGAVAQLFATRYPARVRTMLLTNCDVEFDCPPAALKPVIELAHAGRYAEEWLVPWAADPVLARSEQGLGGLCYSIEGHPTDEAVECYLAPLVQSPGRKALTNRFTIALERNALAGIEAKLRQCMAPTKIVWGEGDRIFSADSPAYLDRILPQSRGVRRLAGAKLFFPEEYPDVIAEEARLLWGVSRSGQPRTIDG
jgi:haloalkane dehalogenase